MWHYANFAGKELLIVGHTIRRNDCILVELEKLPMNEAIELRRIAQSRAGQEHTHLTELLCTLAAPNRVQNWFEYLCYKMEQRNGPVFILPLKEIQDSIEEDQRAIFKGYGKGRKNKYLEQLDNGPAAEAINLDPDLPPQVAPPVNNPKETIYADGRLRAPNNDLGYKMDMLLETMVDQGRQTQQLLAKLIGALTDGDAPEVAVASPAPVKSSKRPSRAKKAVNEERAIVL